MYESFYGLKELPFKITPDDRIFYGGGQRQDMVDALLYAIGRGEGLITVVGEVGIGKTTLARVLVSRLPETVKLISLFTPNLTPDDMLHSICKELSFEMPQGSTRAHYLEALKRYLLEEQGQGRRVVLLIDEAQSVPLETLESLRLLSNLETNDFKLLQMLLFGQPELEVILSKPEARQIQDRVVYQIQLLPFSAEELKGYLDFRMRSAGYQGKMLFTDSVIDAIHAATKGYPRSVNKLVDHVLMSSYAKGQQEFTADDVRAVVNIQQRVQVRNHKSRHGKGFRQLWRGFLDKVFGEPIVRVVVTGVLASVILVVAGYYLASLLTESSKPNVELVAPSAKVHEKQNQPALQAQQVQSKQAPAQTTTAVENNVQHTPSDRLELDVSAKGSNLTTTKPPVVKPEPVELAISEQRIVSETPKSDKAVTHEAVKTADISSPMDHVRVVEHAKPEPVMKANKMASEVAVKDKESIKPTPAPVVQPPKVVRTDSRWPLSGNWIKHHSITLGQLQELNTSGTTQYTIQLMSDPWRLRDPFTARAEQMLENLAPEQVFVTDYVLPDGRPRIALLYGVFADKDEAMRAISRMPMPIQKNSPIILSLNRMIDQMRASDASSRAE